MTYLHSDTNDDEANSEGFERDYGDDEGRAFNLPSPYINAKRPPASHLRKLTKITGVLDSGEFLTDRTVIELAMLLHYADKLEIDVDPRVLLTIIKLIADPITFSIGLARREVAHCS